MTVSKIPAAVLASCAIPSLFHMLTSLYCACSQTLFLTIPTPVQTYYQNIYYFCTSGFSQQICPSFHPPVLLGAPEPLKQSWPNPHKARNKGKMPSSSWSTFEFLYLNHSESTKSHLAICHWDRTCICVGTCLGRGINSSQTL